MGLALDDFEDTVAVQAEAKKLEQEAKRQEDAVVQAAQTGVAPPSDTASAAASTTSPAPQKAEPNLINQAWNFAKPAMNPFHYEEGKPQDYTNLDVPTTVAHGLALGATGLGLAARTKRFISGENAQYAEQNRLAREKFEYQKQQDALAQKAQQQANVTQAPVVQQPAASVAPPKAAPDLYGRIEPTFTAGPVAPVLQQPTIPAGIDPNMPVGPAPSESDMNLVRQSLYNAEDKKIVAGLRAAGTPTPSNAPINVATVNQTGPAIGTPQEVVKASTPPPTVVKAPAPAQKQTFKTPAELPEGTVFKEGWGGADSWLNDQVGKEKAKAIRNTYNQGRGFGSGTEAIKNAATAMAEFGNTQFMTQGEPTILSKENRQRFGIAPPQQAGSLNKAFPKAVKVGGIAGLLLTANEAANAKNLREAAGTVGEAFLPIGMTPTTAGAPVVPPSRFSEAAKLGSPYYNTDWAKQQRMR